MKNLKKFYKLNLKNFFRLLFFVIIIFSKTTNSNEIIIKGNEFTDANVILSLIEKNSDLISEDYSNYLLKTLDNSNYFKDVSVSISDDKYIISVVEFPNIKKIYFDKNERLKDEDLSNIVNELDITNLNPNLINKFIDETTKVYESFGYNNIKISYYDNVFADSNTAELFFEFDEGEITKISRIEFEGNDKIDDSTLRNTIKSKVKSLTNIFANNNFKKFVVENDALIISNLYKDKGYRDIKVTYNVEFLKNNKVNIYYNIVEGNEYRFSKIEYLDKDDILNQNIILNIENEIKSYIENDDTYSLSNINELEQKISNLIINDGLEFFEINLLEKIEAYNVSILFDISSIKPKYAKQINIYGNSRTFDYVIRRELSIIEGDPVHSTQLKNIKDKLKSLNLFKSIEVVEKNIDSNNVNLEIIVEEKQTGTVNAGVSVGTLDGFAIVAGLNERNFYGTGRSVNTLLNTSEDKTQISFQTEDRLFYEDNVDVSFNADYKEENFSKTSSYNLNTASFGFGLKYDLNKKLRHNISLDYVLKDYIITNNQTVSSTIGKSSGSNASFLLSNNLSYSTLNSYFRPNEGESFTFSNIIETPTSSSNGYVKNLLTIKKYVKIKKNIFSNQTRVGNVFSLANNDILTDDKFSLGGRWLRGFDASGAGPRNSRTSYVGGNNLVVTKFDYSREIFNNSNFPILFNLFNDYGLLWENKTKPTKNDNSLRASVGLGIKYYSPIGPIGFSWGFPIMDENYDIKRMFLFSVGNID